MTTETATQEERPRVTRSRAELERAVMDVMDRANPGLTAVEIKALERELWAAVDALEEWEKLRAEA